MSRVKSNSQRGLRGAEWGGPRGIQRKLEEDLGVGSAKGGSHLVLGACWGTENRRTEM